MSQARRGGGDLRGPEGGKLYQFLTLSHALHQAQYEDSTAQHAELCLGMCWRSKDCACSLLL